jgi:hypothetical protein
VSRLAQAQRWLAGRRGQLVAALLVYLAVDFGYFGAPVLPHLGRDCACAGGGDPFDYMWFLAWWPHALLHGQNPFITHALFAPDRINLGAVDVVPGPALVMTPLTLLFGPLLAYNLVALAAPLLAAFFAFLLCRYVTGRLVPSLVGGYVFGFSAYMLGHLEGHLDLVLVFPIPAAVHLVLRRLDDRISARRFAVLLALLLAFLFLCSQELTVTLVLTGVFALLMGYLVAPAARERIRAVVGPIALAGIGAVVLVGVFIYAALTGPVLHSFFNRYSDTNVADLLGYVVPTDVVALGHTWTHSLSAKFSGGIPENGVYLGIPLLLAIGWYAFGSWRRAATRVMVLVFVVIAVLALGSHLHVAGRVRFHIGSHHTIPLPWLALSKLPYLREVAPSRLAVYLFLIAAVMLALWLSSLRRGRVAAVGWALAAVGVAALVPHLGVGAWHSRPENPRLFTGTGHRKVLARGATVLALPFAQDGPSMLWQAETGFRFRLAEGYVGALLPADYVGDLPPAPAGFDPTLTPENPSAIRSYAARRGVSVVVVGAQSAPAWASALAAAGLSGRQVDDAVIYDVPPR